MVYLHPGPGCRVTETEVEMEVVRLERGGQDGGEEPTQTAPRLLEWDERRGVTRDCVTGAGQLVRYRGPAHPALLNQARVTVTRQEEQLAESVLNPATRLTTFHCRACKGLFTEKRTWRRHKNNCRYDAKVDLQL